jgi:hypothetical protein
MYAANSDIWSINNGTLENSMKCASSSARTLFIRTNAVTVVDLSPGFSIGVFSAGIKAKAASAYRTNDCASAVTGSSVVTDTVNTIPVVDRLGIGQSAGATQFYCGTISKLSYYPARLTNEQLVALTS